MVVALWRFCSASCGAFFLHLHVLTVVLWCVCVCTPIFQIGSVIGVYTGKVFGLVEVKPEMVGHYLGEFAISYKPTLHGRPGMGATHSSRFIPL